MVPVVSPIALAVYRKHFETAQLLIRSGSDPTIEESFGESAYSVALLQLSIANIQVGTPLSWLPFGL